MENHVSIVIPCFNEEEFIGECLSSIVNQIYPRHLIEVIVVNGNSTDSSVDKIKQYYSKLAEEMYRRNVVLHERMEKSMRGVKVTSAIEALQNAKKKRASSV